eukprot:Gregarina_sp_Poly_1__10536@NODE_777_length_6336_cov_483_824374_g571_i0_p1_GENE_NODE_777_length_6336_cov_483_824374_g571_i0NODE_777_length_6336_cov_483_824374_g571_i0_p1_ORF_typecomplete_len808_score94_57_NODE_777_length_6336_cov_483_824374_g571_i0532476
MSGVAFLSPSIDEYFLQASIGEVIERVKKLKEGQGGLVSEDSEGPAVVQAVRESEKELLDILAKISKIKNVIVDEAKHIRGVSLDAFNASNRLSPQKENVPFETWFRNCLRNHDFLSALFLEAIFGRSVNLRDRLLKQESCFAGALEILQWDLVPQDVLCGSFLLLTLVLPEVDPSLIFNHLLEQRAQQIEGLISRFSAGEQTHQVLDLALVLNLNAQVDELLSLPENRKGIIECLLRRSSRLVTISRHNCQCSERRAVFNIKSSHPLLVHGSVNASKHCLIFGSDSISLCSLDCLEFNSSRLGALDRVREIKTRSSSILQAALERHSVQVPVQTYSEISCFYSMVMLLLAEWNNNFIVKAPWECPDNLVTALRQTLKCCPSVEQLSAVLEAIQNTDLLKDFQQPQSIYGEDKVLHILRKQYLDAVSELIANKTRKELESALLKTSHIDKVVHHIFLSFWQSFDDQINKNIASPTLYDVIKISPEELKHKLVDALTVALVTTQTADLNINFFHYLWIVVRFETPIEPSMKSVHDAMLSEFLHEFWTESLRMKYQDLSELQGEAATIVDRLFRYTPKQKTTTNLCSDWNPDSVLWIVELLIRHVLPIINRQWSVPTKHNLAPSDEWLDMLRLGFLKQMTVACHDSPNRPSNLAFILALYKIVISEQPTIVEENGLLFTASLELGNLLNESSKEVPSDIRTQAEGFANTIVTLLQPFIGRNLRVSVCDIQDSQNFMETSQTERQAKFFKKLPVVRRVPLPSASASEDGNSSPNLALPSNEASFSLSHLLTVRPAFTTAFGALWDNVTSK